MQLNISHLFSAESPFVPFDCSNNAATLGDNAGRLTWNASKECAAALVPPLLDTEEKREAFRDFVKSSGGWNKEEIAAWNDNELNALLIQWIAGDVREAFGDAQYNEWDWDQYQADAHTQEAVLNHQCDVVQDFDTSKEARAYAKRTLTDEYQRLSEMAEPLRYAQVRCGDECLADYFRKETAQERAKRATADLHATADEHWDAAFNS